jgi:hypothetical protein
MSLQLSKGDVHPAYTNVAPATKVGTLVRTEIWSNRQQDTTEERNNDRNERQVPEDGQKITTDNAHKFFEWHKQYGVLTCNVHYYAVRNLSSHLRDYHSRSMKEKRAVVDLLKDYKIREAKDVILPPPSRAPFASLGKPLQAFTYSEPECEYISISRKGIWLHCNQKHD